MLNPGPQVRRAPCDRAEKICLKFFERAMKLLEIASGEQLFENARKLLETFSWGRIFSFASFDLPSPVPVFALCCLNTRINWNGQCKSLHRKGKIARNFFPRTSSSNKIAQKFPASNFEQFYCSKFARASNCSKMLAISHERANFWLRFLRVG